MNIKNIFCLGKEPEEKENLGLYADMLGLNKEFKFVLSKQKVATEVEFNDVCKEAEKLLKNDLIRLGEDFYKIPKELKGCLNTSIGSMTIIADNDGKLTARFHRRDEDGYWDDKTLRYPEKSASGKWKHEIFFIFDKDED